MKQSFLSAFTALAFLTVLGLGCNQLKGTDAVPTEKPNPQPAAAEKLGGEYDVTGMNENGAGAYRGTLTVAERGDVYQFSWDTAGKKYDGVGVRTDDSVGVAFAEGNSGEGCGVVLYKIAANGKLDGKAGYWGNDSSETETATQTKGNGLEGDYEVSGTNTAGQKYEGKLAVKKSGEGYTFSWNAGSTFEGFGVRQGDMVAVGIGGTKCGFVSYEVKPGGTLDGKWGGYGSKAVGTETAKKK